MRITLLFTLITASILHLSAASAVPHADNSLNTDAPSIVEKRSPRGRRGGGGRAITGGRRPGTSAPRPRIHSEPREQWTPNGPWAPKVNESPDGDKTPPDVEKRSPRGRRGGGGHAITGGRRPGTSASRPRIHSEPHEQWTPDGPWAPKDNEGPDGAGNNEGSTQKPNTPAKIHQQFLEAFKQIGEIPHAELVEEARDKIGGDFRPTGPDDTPWRRLSEQQRTSQYENARLKGDNLIRDQRDLHENGKSRLSLKQQETRGKEFEGNYILDEHKTTPIQVSPYTEAGVHIEAGTQLDRMRVRAKTAKEGGNGGDGLIRFGLNAEEGAVERSLVWRTGPHEKLRATDLLEWAIVKMTPKGFSGRVLDKIRTWRIAGVNNQLTVNTFISALKQDPHMIDQKSLKIEKSDDGAVISGIATSREGDTHFSALTQSPNLRTLIQADMDYGSGNNRPVAASHTIQFQLMIPTDKDKFATEIKIPSIVTKFRRSGS